MSIQIDYMDLIQTYSSRSIPKKQSDLLKERKWLPLYINDDLMNECAYLVGKIMGDGNLDPLFTIRFVNGDKNDLILLSKLINKKFNISFERMAIREKKALGKSYLLQINDTIFGRLLYALGAPQGNKVKQSFLIPEWISSSKLTKKRFLQGILEDELTTIKIEQKNYAVSPRFKMAKLEDFIPNLKEFLIQIKDMIMFFGIGCSNLSNPISRTNQKTKELYFHINRNKQNILKFKKKIGFRLNIDKIEKLNSCCETILNSLK